MLVDINCLVDITDKWWLMISALNFDFSVSTYGEIHEVRKHMKSWDLSSFWTGKPLLWVAVESNHPLHFIPWDRR